MAYLKSSNILQESITTMGSQFLSNLKQVFDLDSYFDDDHRFRYFLQEKRKHFDAHHAITEKLKAKLRSWVREIPGVLIVPISEMEKLLYATNTGEYQFSNISIIPSRAGGYMMTQNIETDAPNVLKLQQKTRRNTPYNRFTNATCHYVLDMGDGKCALVFFTFDDEEIKSASVITSNQYAQGGSTSGLGVVKIEKWKTVMPSEYRK